jgi:hypothetical protein
MKIAPKDFLTVAQVAKLCGVSANAVYQRLGALKAVEHFGVYVIPQAEAEKYRHARLTRMQAQIARATP